MSDEFADRRWMAVQHRFRAVTPAESGVGQPCPAMRVAAHITLFGAAQAAKTGDHLAAQKSQLGGSVRFARVEGQSQCVSRSIGSPGFLPNIHARYDGRPA